MSPSRSCVPDQMWTLPAAALAPGALDEVCQAIVVQVPGSDGPTEPVIGLAEL